MKNDDKRLYSLDTLRGLDMILLTLVGPLVYAAQKGWGIFPQGFMRQFDHGWVCFTLWDMIMPLFIFMCGAAIPLALERRLGTKGFWNHVLGRAALLWTLGGLIQGNWASFNLAWFSPFSNTLQSIAVGYIAVAAAMATRRTAVTIAVPIACSALYTAMLAVGGDYTEFGNFAFKTDIAVLKAILPADSVWIAKPSIYTWFATSLMFAAMAFAGYHATRIIKSAGDGWRKVRLLAVYGAALIAVGALALVWIPCIKPIYTLSFTALSMGVSVLLLGALYAVNDVVRWRRGWGFAVFFGRASLAAYFISHFFRSVLSAAANQVGGGFVRLLPESARPFTTQLLVSAALVLAMFAWRRVKAKPQT